MKLEPRKKRRVSGIVKGALGLGAVALTVTGIVTKKIIASETKSDISCDEQERLRGEQVAEGVEHMRLLGDVAYPEEMIAVDSLECLKDSVPTPKDTVVYETHPPLGGMMMMPPPEEDK